MTEPLEIFIGLTLLGLPFVLLWGQVKQVMTISDVEIIVWLIVIVLPSDPPGLPIDFFLAKNLHLFCTNQFVITGWSLRVLITKTRWSSGGMICSVSLGWSGLPSNSGSGVRTRWGCNERRGEWVMYCCIISAHSDSALSPLLFLLFLHLLPPQSTFLVSLIIAACTGANLSLSLQNSREICNIFALRTSSLTLTLVWLKDHILMVQ